MDFFIVELGRLKINEKRESEILHFKRPLTKAKSLPRQREIERERERVRERERERVRVRGREGARQK
jgi:hypothetical protein